jgi:hypothetical protein
LPAARIFLQRHPDPDLYPWRKMNSVSKNIQFEIIF